MPYRNGNIVWNATQWTEDMITYLKENFNSKTNKQLADHLGLKLTITRNKCRELGLKRMELEYWSREQVEFLKNNYKTLGDVEIMDHFKKHWPKVKGWKRGAIRKKRQQMGLERSPQEINAILDRHHQEGGRMFTIKKNSSSANMHDRWVAGQIAWRDPELREQILKHRPDLIELKRQLIIFKRKINELKKRSA
jgi:hypothetical protein